MTPASGVRINIIMRQSYKLNLYTSAARQQFRTQPLQATFFLLENAFEDLLGPMTVPLVEGLRAQLDKCIGLGFVLETDVSASSRCPKRSS